MGWGFFGDRSVFMIAIFKLNGHVSSNFFKGVERTVCEKCQDARSTSPRQRIGFPEPISVPVILHRNVVSHRL